MTCSHDGEWANDKSMCCKWRIDSQRVLWHVALALVTMPPYWNDTCPSLGRERVGRSVGMFRSNWIVGDHCCWLRWLMISQPIMVACNHYHESLVTPKWIGQFKWRVCTLSAFCVHLLPWNDDDAHCVMCIWQVVNSLLASSGLARIKLASLLALGWMVEQMNSNVPCSGPIVQPVQVNSEPPRSGHYFVLLLAAQNVTIVIVTGHAVTLGQSVSKKINFVWFVCVRVCVSGAETK